MKPNRCSQTHILQMEMLMKMDTNMGNETMFLECTIITRSWSSENANGWNGQMWSRYTGCSRNKIRIIKKKNHTILYMCDQYIFWRKWAREVKGCNLFREQLHSTMTHPHMSLMILSTSTKPKIKHPNFLDPLINKIIRVSLIVVDTSHAISIQWLQL
jgi:hypothetical protein